MKIAKIIIKNFRSIQEVAIDPQNFNVFVGQNNHGKTNFVEAVHWFYLGGGNIDQIKNAKAKGGDDFSVELVFSGVQEGLPQISLEKNQVSLSKILGSSDEMRIRRVSSKPKERHIYHPETDEWKKQPCGADSAFNNCMPRFEFVEATKNFKDVGNYKSTSPIGKMLGGVLNEILLKDEEYKAFREQFDKLFSAESSGIQQQLQKLSSEVCGHLTKQFPDCSSVDFQVKEPAFDDLLKNFETKVDDGISTTAEEKGDGMQRALMLSIIKTYADQRRTDDIGRSFIFFIDEAELHLHPSAQRQLKTALLELTADGHDQVFINTHSSVLITDDDQQAVFKVQKDAVGESQVEKISSPAEKHQVVFELLGGSPADILLPANFLIVEGPSEEALLRTLIRRFYSDKPEIQIIAAGGDDEQERKIYAAVDNLLATLARRPIYRNKLVILFDQPRGEEKLQRFNRFKSDHSHLVNNDQLFELNTQTLEEYYPQEVREMFPEIRRKTKLAKKIGQAITQEQFESEMPIIFHALEKCWAHAYQD